jgi:transducin (beta)-like 1
MFNDHKTPVFAVCFSPDGRFLTTGGGDGWLYVYDVKVISYFHFLWGAHFSHRSQNRSKRWQWDVSDGLPDMPEGETTESLKMVSKGIFEIDWQSAPDCNRIAVTLETKQVAIVDTKRIPELL